MSRTFSGKTTIQIFIWIFVFASIQLFSRGQMPLTLDLSQNPNPNAQFFAGIIPATSNGKDTTGLVADIAMTGKRLAVFAGGAWNDGAGGGIRLVAISRHTCRDGCHARDREDRQPTDDPPRPRTEFAVADLAEPFVAVLHCQSRGRVGQHRKQQ